MLITRTVALLQQLLTITAILTLCFISPTILDKIIQSIVVQSVHPSSAILWKCFM